MSDELEARMWDEGGSRYESRSRGSYFEPAFASSEHLDRAPLLSEPVNREDTVCIIPSSKHLHTKFSGDTWVKRI
ncbi:jg24988 [Pararge aegeria aegeria]|uniref:Jg24988 protein n=1 Tax=Pararge aegeria aegeria TaxID=348720 RepID=A0A8S4S178_9NEOP|nr:jg24988 [Pararge aegeria aegeria]